MASSTSALTTPLIKQGDRFVPASWPEALATVAEGLASSGAKGDEIKAVAGALADAESMVLLKDLVNKLGSDNLATDQINGDKAPIHGADLRSNYTFNSTIAGIEEADVLLLVGTNPRHEAAIVNTRIRKAYLHTGLDVGLIGEKVDLTYEYDHVGTDAKAVQDLLAGKGAFAKKFKEAQEAHDCGGQRRGGAPGRQGDPGQPGRAGQGEQGQAAQRRVERLQRAAAPGVAHRATTATWARSLPTCACPARAYTEKATTYVNTEGPHADDARGGAATGRSARGLEDCACAERGGGRDAAVQRHSGRAGQARQEQRVGRTAVETHPELLPDRPHLARVTDHGQVHGRLCRGPAHGQGRRQGNARCVQLSISGVAWQDRCVAPFELLYVSLLFSLLLLARQSSFGSYVHVADRANERFE
ncbi:hypothetical protein L1887_53676 [Cichorium endivia]|nr:hypothetical protein L1887_53676 [Cichorium endivia]